MVRNSGTPSAGAGKLRLDQAHNLARRLAERRGELEDRRKRWLLLPKLKDANERAAHSRLERKALLRQARCES